MIEIPLNSNPEQLFSIVLIDISYDIRVALNSRTGIWSISFSREGTHVINGVPLLGGIDILKQHNLPISNIYVVNLDKSNEDPTNVNLGIVAKLFILTDEEITSG